MKRRLFEVERVMLDLAAPQHGVVSYCQLLAAGVSRHMVDRRLRAGLLERLHHGVYRVGPIVAPRAREMAAVLACDGRSVISHRTATALWQVTPQQPASESVEVMSPHGHYRRQGIRARRVRNLLPDEVTTLDAIPVTTVARSLMDLASVTSGRPLERAVAEAYALKLTTRAAIVRLLGRHVGQPGAGRLLGLVESKAPALTRSEAEELFLAAVRGVGLPAPEVNVRLCGYEVDFYWRKERYAVEVDGFAFHSSADRFESDRHRDGVLAAAGIRVMRVTWRQVTDEPGKMLVRLAQALALAARSA
ncbi:MAG: type IV toxin-antitoxin system AbiEi family antitoxin domain-containing protein [Gemmatimonadota bacterium]